VTIGIESDLVVVSAIRAARRLSEREVPPKLAGEREKAPRLSAGLSEEERRGFFEAQSNT
jgi:hypothetical protein